MSENENIEKVEMEEELTTAPQPPAKAEKSDKVKKAKADDKKAKPGFFARIGKWFKEMKAELKKVQWPTSKQTVNNTLIVIVCCIVVGVCIRIFDGLASAIIRALLDLFKG